MKMDAVSKAVSKNGAVIHDFKNGIYAIDSFYEREGAAAVYVILDNGRAAIVDTAHNDALVPVLEGVRALGIPRENVDYIFLTHVHLDHAGGAGRFMHEFPNARLVVHSRGARHMIDPAKLLAGVRAVYGDAETARMYGELLPVPADRVISPEDGDEFRVGNRTIVAMDTPGHAKHHLAFWDKTANAVFSGDVFGISFPEMTGPQGQGVIPTTSPIQFDPAAMRASIDRIVALNPDRLYPTHFGEIRDVRAAAAHLHRQIEAHERIAMSAAGDVERARAGVEALFQEERVAQGWPLPPEAIPELFKIEIELNAQGLAALFEQRRKDKE